MIKENNTANKIGMKKSGNKRMKIKPISDKHSKDLKEYLKISGKLKELANHKSELTGKQEGYYDPLVCHHIGGRDGKVDLLNPFNMIILLHSEHNNSNESIHKHNSFEKKETLRLLIRPTRLNQGFKEEDYL